MLTSRISSCLRALVAAVTLPTAVSLAGIGPENVAVVVNGESWASLTVANEYARLRHIPQSNFIVLGGISSIDQTDVERFRSEILLPVFAALDARGLTAQIDCIAYSCDIPYAASVHPDTTGKQFPHVITGVASTNGLTYLHEWVRRKDTDYLRLDINRYTRRTLPLTMSMPLSAAEQAEYRRGMTLYDAKKYEEAAAAIAALNPASRGDPGMFYNLACCQALAGRADDAMTSLRAAAALGWRNHGQTTSDPDLKSLADRGDFKKLVSDMKSAVVEVQPTRGFRSRYAWDQAGEPADSGPRYMLSTMLGVTCGRGNSVNEVLDSLRRAAGADGDAPSGTIYFLKNGDVRSSTRDWAFPSAMAQLRSLGIRCVTDEGVLPQGREGCRRRGDRHRGLRLAQERQHDLARCDLRASDESRRHHRRARRPDPLHRVHPCRRGRHLRHCYRALRTPGEVPDRLHAPSLRPRQHARRVVLPVALRPVSAPNHRRPALPAVGQGGPRVSTGPCRRCGPLRHAGVPSHIDRLGFAGQHIRDVCRRTLRRFGRSRHPSEARYQQPPGRSP